MFAFKRLLEALKGRVVARWTAAMLFVGVDAVHGACYSESSTPRPS